MEEPKMRSLLKYRYSFLAGACAAAGSFFGKLPSFLSAINLLQPNTLQFMGGSNYAVQLLPLGLMVFFNVCNLRYFLKSLQMTQQTLTATVLTAASNYVLSFILGCLVYREPFSLLSATGITLILSGLWFLCDTGDIKKPFEPGTTDKQKQS